MPGILPDAANGGLIRRDAAGVCLNPAGVQQAYCPPATFLSTCSLTALPSDCTARITAAQINALVSEMLCLAVALTPTGTWDCASTCNLSSAFLAWAAANKIVDGTTIVGAGTTADPFRVAPVALVGAICADNAAGDALAACLISTAAGNTITVGPDGRLLGGAGGPAPTPPGTGGGIIGDGTAGNLIRIDPATIAGVLCADPVGDALATCMRSTDAGNAIVAGTDGRLFAPPGGGGGSVVTGGGIIGDGTAGNVVRIDPATIATVLCADPVGDALAACLISADAGNTLQQGTDGRLLARISPLVRLPTPAIGLRYTREDGNVLDIPQVDQLQVDSFTFQRLTNFPLGTTFANVFLSWPVVPITLNNPWADTPCSVNIQGSIFTGSGWDNANLVAGLYLLAGALRIAQGQYTSLISKANGGLSFAHDLPQIGAGGSAPLTIGFDTFIPSDAGATEPAQSTSFAYIITYSRWNL